MTICPNHLSLLGPQKCKFCMSSNHPTSFARIKEGSGTGLCLSVSSASFPLSRLFSYFPFPPSPRGNTFGRMYHELILALNGYPGDVFFMDKGEFHIHKDLLQASLLHPSEFQLLRDVLEVASLHKKVADFVENNEQVVTSKSSEGSTGLYVGSICNGINEIRNKYVEEIIQLEMKVLDDPYLTMTHIRVQLEPFRNLFTALLSLILKIESQAKSSAVIVEIVKNYYEVNIPLQSDLQILVPWANKTLYRQITNWVTFGNLFDPYEEFFVQYSPSTKIDLSDGSKSDLRMNDRYLVNFSVVPSHFPCHLTDRILFVGYAIGILSNSDKTRVSLYAKQKEFFTKMSSLPTDTFRIEELDDAISDLATAVGKDLHRLVVAETDLSKYLSIVKDFYLTGRGELFHDFLLSLKEMPLSKISLTSDIRQAFAVSAGRVQVQEEVLQRVKISAKKELGVSVDSLCNCIPILRLEMEDEWPLHILFTQECIAKYNEMFGFLLQVRHLQLELNLLWTNTRKIFRFPIPKGPAELRSVMSFFIDHLQHYLQEDVLENQYIQLCQAIDKSDNFEQIRIAHAKFQTSILNQSFRSSNKLKHFVDEIIVVCNKFVKYMNKQLERCERKNVPINEGVSDEISNFSTDFRRHMDLLLNLLKGVAVNPQSGQYLGQFLLRLDFNSYFSSIIVGLEEAVD